MTGGSTRRGPPASLPQAVDAGHATLVILGDRANLLIVREAFRWARRYQDFKERLGMSDAVLTSRLRDLVKLGVFRTEQYSSRPPRSEYRLTECGIDFWRTALGIWSWERTWGDNRDGRLPELVHVDGGHPTGVSFGCAVCSTAGVSLSDIAIDIVRAVERVSILPLRRYRRASWKPSPGIALYSEIDPLLGDRWMVATVAATMIGVDRFAELQRTLDISPPLLSKRLAELVRREVLERVIVARGGHHHRYRLLPKGRDLMPILLANYAWVNRWFPVDGGESVSIMHSVCGEALVPAWFCAECGTELDRSSMSFNNEPPSRSPRLGTAGVRAGSYRV